VRFAPAFSFSPLFRSSFLLLSPAPSNPSNFAGPRRPPLFWIPKVQRGGAVGTMVAHRPPRGAVRAELPHKMLSTTSDAQCGEAKNVARPGHVLGVQHAGFQLRHIIRGPSKLQRSQETHQITVLSPCGFTARSPAGSSNRCLAPDFLDTELSVFMQRLQVQEAAGEPGRA